MIKYILFFIFALSSLQASACNYSDLLSHLKDVKDLTNLAPLNCADSIYYMDKDEVCECVVENEKFIIPKVSFNKKQKIPFVDKALEKAEIGLYNISKEVLNMAVMANLKSGPKFKPSSECNLSKRLKENGQNSVFSCSKYPGKHILSKDQRKKFAHNLATQYANELVNAYDGKSLKPALVDRTKSKNQNSCSLPEKKLMKINHISATTELSILIEIIRENRTILKDAKDIQTALTHLRASTDGQYSKHIIYQLQNFKYNPTLEHLFNSQSFLQEILLSNKDGGELYRNSLSSGELERSLNENLNKKCKEVFNHIEETLCLTEDDNVLPSNSDQVIDIFTKIEKKSNANEAEKHIITSNILKKEYCTEKVSDVDKLKKKINNGLPPNLARTNNRDEVYKRDFQNNIIHPSNQICSYLPPNQSIDELKANVNKCKKESEQQNKLYDSKCMQMQVVLASVQSKYQKKLAEIEALSLKQAKDEIVATGKDPDDPSVLEKAKKIAKTMKDKIDTSKFFDSIDDKKDSNLSTNDPGAQIIADFIGGEVQEAMQATSQENIASNNDPSGSSRSASSSQGSNSSNLTAASMTAASGLPNQVQPSGSFNEINSEEHQTKKNMNQIYEELSRRITQTRPARQAARVAAGVGPQEAYISKDLEQAIESPYPQESEEEIYVSDAGTYDPVISNFYDTNKTFSNNNSDNLATTSSSENSTQSEIQKSYNNALASANKAKEAARIKAANKGKVKPSPFKSLGKSIANGRSPSSSNLTNSGSLSFAEKTLPLNAETVQGDLEALIDNVLAEKASGIEGENLEHATAILNMLDSRAVTIKSDLNPNFEVQILKQKNGYELIVPGNMADPAYKRFVKKINELVILKKNKFKDILKRLKLAVDKGVKITNSGPNTIRYRDITNYR